MMCIFFLRGAILKYVWRTAAKFVPSLFYLFHTQTEHCLVNDLHLPTFLSLHILYIKYLLYIKPRTLLSSFVWCLLYF